MGLDLWFKDDVRRILAGVLEAAALNRELSNDYRRGFERAIEAMSTAFGLNEPSSTYIVRGREWLSTSEGPRST